MDRPLRVHVISTLFSPDPWGASEELWRLAALANLAAGGAVSLSIRRRSRPLPEQVAALVVAGAALGLRRDWYGWRQRVLERSGWGRRSVARHLTKAHPDVVLVSHAGAFDVLSDPGFMRWTRTWCTSKGVPFVALVQANDHRRVLDRGSEEAARDYFTSATRVLFVSHGNWRALEHQIACPLPRGAVVRNPVQDLGLLAWPAAATTRFACVGRLHVQTKGQDLLLRAFAQLDVGSDWRLSLYGAGPDEAKLRSLAKKLGLDDRVRFMGVADVADIWREEQVMVMASRMEGASLAMGEAMLAGRPVVMTDVGGAAEWIDHGVTGLVMLEGTVDGIAETLAEVLRWGPALEEMGREGRERAMAMSDPDPGGTLVGLLDDLVDAS